MEIINHRQPERSSQTAAIAEIPVEKKRALGDVIDRWRLNLGWRPLDDASQEMAIQSWVNILDAENIPHQAYNELFSRSLRLRANALAQGKQPPDFGVELLLACWTGENGLQREIYQRKIDEGRTLTQHAESSCQYCFGTNMRHSFDEKGKPVAVIGRCDHSDN